jgi:hypothetical protein
VCEFNFSGLTLLLRKKKLNIKKKEKKSN